MKALDGQKETASGKDTIDAISNANGGNISGLKADIQEGVKKLENLADERTAINASMNSIRSDLEAKGVHKKALNMAMQYLNMDPDKREGFDIAYSIVREAMGLDFEQGELFEGDAE